MNNKVDLTDDELSVIQTSLEVSIRSFEKYIEINGESSLDFQTREAFQSMKKLHAKLNKEYF
jgi:hypothetical protein